MSNFKFTQDYAAEATFGLLSDWMLKIRGAYTSHDSLGRNFSAESVGVTVVKRFWWCSAAPPRADPARRLSIPAPAASGNDLRQPRSGLQPQAEPGRSPAGVV